MARIGKSKEEVLFLAGELGIDVEVKEVGAGTRYIIGGKKYKTGMDAHAAIKNAFLQREFGKLEGRGPKVSKRAEASPDSKPWYNTSRKIKPKKVVGRQRTVEELEKIAMKKRSEALRDASKALNSDGVKHRYLKRLAKTSGVEVNRISEKEYEVVVDGKAHGPFLEWEARNYIRRVFYEKLEALYADDPDKLQDVRRRRKGLYLGPNR